MLGPANWDTEGMGVLNQEGFCVPPIDQFDQN